MSSLLCLYTAKLLQPQTFKIIKGKCIKIVCLYVCLASDKLRNLGKNHESSFSLKTTDFCGVRIAVNWQCMMSFSVRFLIHLATLPDDVLLPDITCIAWYDLNK